MEQSDKTETRLPGDLAGHLDHDRRLMRDANLAGGNFVIAPVKARRLHITSHYPGAPDFFDNLSRQIPRVYDCSLDLCGSVNHLRLLQGHSGPPSLRTLVARNLNRILHFRKFLGYVPFSEQKAATGSLVHSSKRCISFSSITFTPSSFALSSLEPASLPATT
jgi:hypothetical protein